MVLVNSLILLYTYNFFFQICIVPKDEPASLLFLTQHNIQRFSLDSYTILPVSEKLIYPTLKIFFVNIEKIKNI